ncbi:MAG: hypothetical protein QXP27_09315 [Candidatus Methanomethyliaceae archaeon]
MIWKRSKWRMCVAVMLSVLLLLVPAMTGYAATQLLGKTNSLNYQELNGPELDQLAQKAIDDNGVQQLVKYLSGGKAILAGKRAFRVRFNGQEGSISLLNYKGKEDLLILYGESGGKVKVGAGVYKMTDHKTQIEAYDFVDGKIYHSSTITVTKDSNGRPSKLLIEWHSSPLNPPSSGKTINIPIVSSLTTSNCTTCLNVCNYIYGAGCSITGALVCLAACAPIANIACPVICAVVWWYLCTQGVKGCTTVCTIAGYCP